MAKQKGKRRVRERAKKLNREFRKILATAIATAAGLIVAFAWRDVLTEILDKITTLNPIQGKIINAFIITIAAVFVIMLTVRLNPEK